MRDATPSAQQCCLEIYTLMTEHEAKYPNHPHMNLVRTEWNKIKRMAKLGGWKIPVPLRFTQIAETK